VHFKIRLMADGFPPFSIEVLPSAFSHRVERARRSGAAAHTIDVTQKAIEADGVARTRPWRHGGVINNQRSRIRRRPG
jgi:hypothetical protein